MSERLTEAIRQARKFMRKGEPHIANYVLRDLPETEDAALSDLSWAMHRDGNVSNNDVEYLIQELESRSP